MAMEGNYRVERAPVLELVAWMADTFAWQDVASDCLDAMAVKP